MIYFNVLKKEGFYIIYFGVKVKIVSLVFVMMQWIYEFVVCIIIKIYWGVFNLGNKKIVIQINIYIKDRFLKNGMKYELIEIQLGNKNY